MSVIIGGDGKQHTNIGTFRPHPKLVGQNEAEVMDALRKKIQSVSLLKLLRDTNIVVRGGCGPKIDEVGYAKEGDEVVVSLHGLSYILSLALRLHNDKIISGNDLPYLTPHKIQDTKVECLLDIYNLCLHFNSFPIEDDISNDLGNEENRLKIFSPISAVQERFSTPQMQFLSRCKSWFEDIPKLPGKYSIPDEVKTGIELLFDVPVSDFASATFILYTAAIYNHGITPETFTHLNSAGIHSSYRLLMKIGTPISEYIFTSVEDGLGLNSPIMHQSPILIRKPIIKIKDGLWSIPIPRLILNKMVEGAYWDLFDYFHEKYENVNNPYTTWFGHVFEKYVASVMTASFTRKMREEVVYSEQDKSPDLLEVHIDRAILIEAKSRRPNLRSKLIYDRESVNKLKGFASEVVDQVLRFIGRHCNDSDGVVFSSVKDYIVLAVTPEAWLVNGFVAQGLFDVAIEAVCRKYSHVKSIRILFLPVSDLEIVPKLAGHLFAYDLFDRYLSSKYYPYRSFSDFMRLGSGISLATRNPYVEGQGRQSMEIARQSLRISEGFVNT